MHQQIVRFLVISIGDELYAVVEEGEVESYIEGVCFFPLQFTIRIVACIETSTPDGGCRSHGDAVGIGTRPLVTYYTQPRRSFSELMASTSLRKASLLTFQANATEGNQPQRLSLANEDEPSARSVAVSK